MASDITNDPGPCFYCSEETVQPGRLIMGKVRISSIKHWLRYAPDSDLATYVTLAARCDIGPHTTGTCKTVSIAEVTPSGFGSVSIPRKDRIQVYSS